MLPRSGSAVQLQSPDLLVLRDWRRKTGWSEAASANAFVGLNLCAHVRSSAAWRLQAGLVGPLWVGAEEPLHGMQHQPGAAERSRCLQHRASATEVCWCGRAGVCMHAETLVFKHAEGVCNPTLTGWCSVPGLSPRGRVWAIFCCACHAMVCSYAWRTHVRTASSCRLRRLRSAC